MTDLAPLRVGVTGSRTYRDVSTIREALVDACRRGRPHEGHLLIHGQCDPQHPDMGRRIPWRRAKKLSIEVQGRLAGADWLCEWVALELEARDCMPWDICGYPADWYPGGTFDRTAGFRRNGQMVEAGADEWEAFLALCVKPGCRQPRPHPSHGASHCADLAWKSGIPVYRFTDVTLATAT